ncbi:hypothetical protein F2Q68_00035724 [Brassica cretica]|uniref:Uncharacterized protein n=1 Tax=Brassica cretica TaxID=69181 RepID=A0A8S9H547_BRACR|nr:hypothetical protein F2Q68_00035724 [Brassica cretica]
MKKVLTIGMLGGNRHELTDVPLGSAPGKTKMHGLIMGSSGREILLAEEKSSLGVVKMFEADQRRLFSQFEVREFCDNLVEGVVKALRDVRKIQKKRTTTRAPVAESSLFISEKTKGKSKNNLEDLKDFSDSLPIFDEYNEELIESLIIFEDECDLPSPKSDFMFDDEETNGLTCFEPEHPSGLVLFSQNFEEEPFDYSHQGPLLGTRRPMDDDLGSIFDEEEELGPTFDEKAPSMTSISMENHLCFDPGRTPTPLTTDIQEHCKKLDLINFLSEICVKISSQDVKRFGFDKSFQHDNGINSGFALSFDQFLKHIKGFDHFEESLELDLQQPDFCARNSFDSFVFKENSFNLSCYRYALITGKETLVSDLNKINMISLQEVSGTEAEIVLISLRFGNGKMDLRSNTFQEGRNDVLLGSAPGKTNMHGLIMGSSKDICSLFDSYIPNHESYKHEITCRMFST